MFGAERKKRGVVEGQKDRVLIHSIPVGVGGWFGGWLSYDHRWGNRVPLRIRESFVG